MSFLVANRRIDVAKSRDSFIGLDGAGRECRGVVGGNFLFAEDVPVAAQLEYQGVQREEDMLSRRDVIVVRKVFDRVERAPTGGMEYALAPGSDGEVVSIVAMVLGVGHDIVPDAPAMTLTSWCTTKSAAMCVAMPRK